MNEHADDPTNTLEFRRQRVVKEPESQVDLVSPGVDTSLPPQDRRPDTPEVDSLRLGKRKTAFPDEA